MIQYAKRLEKIPPYLFGEISRLKAQAIAEGRDLIDFGIGDPDQPTPQPVIDKLTAAANDPATHRYDETDYTWPEVTGAFASWYEQRFGVKLDHTKGEVIGLIGSKEGLAHLAWAYIDEGDVSLVPDPGYTVYKVNTAMAGGTPVAMPLLAENDFLPDLTAIPSDVAKSAKLMYINYPNNPTAAVATEEFFADVVAFAKNYDIIVCQDAAYSEVTFDGHSSPSFLKVPGAMDVGIEMHSCSKTCNMTGWRVGFAVGNADILRGLVKIKSNIDSKQFPAVMLAGVWALQHPEYNRDTFSLYEKRRNILIEGLNELGWRLPKPKATLYAWVPVPPGYTSTDFAKALLEKAGVLVVPGLAYGEHGEGYVRFSLTVAGDMHGERIAEGVRRIKENLAIRW